MKKLIVIGIVTLMVMGLAVAGNAYVLQGIADNGNSLYAMSSLTWGTNTSASSKNMGANPGNDAELAIAGNQSWDPAVLGSTGNWVYQDFLTVSPPKDTFYFGLWGGATYTGLAATPNQARVIIWASSLTGLGGGSYVLKNVKTGETYWTGTITATGNKTTPLLSVMVTVPDTAAPDSGALLVSFGQVPEPGSMLAMLSGLVGLLGFGIRRRK